MGGNVRAAREKKSPLFMLAVLFVLVGCASRPPTKPAAVPPEPTSKEKIIHRIAVSEDKATALVTIYASRSLNYTAVKHHFPLGVVLYFPDTGLKGVKGSDALESTVIKAIQTSELKEGRRSSRIEINLKADVPYEVTQEENRVLVHFKKPIVEPKGAEGPEKGIEVAKKVQPKAQREVKPEPAAPAPVIAEEVKGPAWVNRIDFQMMEDGKSQVIVGTTRKIRYKTERILDKKLLLKLFDTRIPKSQRRPLITTRFKCAVDRILPIQTAKMGDMAVIAIELREAVPYRIQQKENLCLLDFEASAVPPRPMPEAERPEWVQAMKEAEVAIVKEVEAPPEKAIVTETGKIYTGVKISLDFQDADIHNIFRILHEVSGKNFVIGGDVKGRVTLKLDNVPWDQVLDLILKMNRLEPVVEGNIVRIATLSTLAAEQKALKAKMKAEQEAKEQEDLVTAYIPINYAVASSTKLQIDEIKTDRGKVTVDERTNMIIMKDVQAAIDNAREVVKRLDVVTPQVMIEARIVEASTDFARELGIKWGGQYYATGHDASATTSGRLFGANMGGDYDAGTANYAVNLPAFKLPSALNYAAGLGFTFGRVGGTTLNLDLRLMAMETNSRGKIISRPKIATLDNETATIKQGYDYPFKILNEETGITTITWKAVDLLLEVTPHITPDNRVNMEIKTTKNDIKDLEGETTIAKNEAETKLLINDGETIVIGGIIKDTLTWAERKVPFFGDIPILGWLFKSRYRKTEKAELLIFITPKIIRLEEASQVTS